MTPCWSSDSKIWHVLPPFGVWLYFLADLLQGRLVVSMDTTNLVYVIRRWHFDTWLAQGDLPQWNSALFSGILHGTDPQLGLYSPLSWFLRLFLGYWGHPVFVF